MNPQAPMPQINWHPIQKLVQGLYKSATQVAATLSEAKNFQQEVLCFITELYFACLRCNAVQVQDLLATKSQLLTMLEVPSDFEATSYANFSFLRTVLAIKEESRALSKFSNPLLGKAEAKSSTPKASLYKLDNGVFTPFVEYKPRKAKSKAVAAIKAEASDGHLVEYDPKNPPKKRKATLYSPSQASQDPSHLYGVFSVDD